MYKFTVVQAKVNSATKEKKGNVAAGREEKEAVANTRMYKVTDL